jgi:hypothetical protein
MICISTYLYVLNFVDISVNVQWILIIYKYWFCILILEPSLGLLNPYMGFIIMQSHDVLKPPLAP